MAQTRTRNPRPSAKKAKKSRAPFVIIGGAIVIALVIAIVATRNSGKGDTTLAQTQPVTVSGNPLPMLPDSGADAALGSAVPELKGAAFDGSAINIANDGHPKIVIFVAHWCPHCQAEVPVITKWIADNGAPAGVDVYAVSTGVSKDLPNYPPSSWLAKEKWPLPTLADSNDSVAAQAFGLSAYPYFVVVNASGKLMYRATGELETTRLAQLVTLAES